MAANKPVFLRFSTQQIVFESLKLQNNSWTQFTGGLEKQISVTCSLKHSFPVAHIFNPSPPFHLVAAMFGQKKTSRSTTGQKKHDLGMVKKKI